MAHSALTPVFLGLRMGLHLLTLVLLGVVVARTLVRESPSTAAVLVLTLVFGAVYALGAVFVRSRSRRAGLAAVTWLAVLTLAWLPLLWLVPEAAYLVFPLFFLYLHLLPGATGPAAVLVTTGGSVLALGFHGGWNVGVVIGPCLGAAVALLVGLGYRSLSREAAERERLVEELLTTRGRLAATEREAGVLAERARLAREIHDTLAQGLSSIQMLLHAAEREDDGRPGIEHVRLARETAAGNLADARRFIRELSPPALDEHGITEALERLAAGQWTRPGLTVHVRADDALALPMHVQTALLRIAQGAMANVLRHSEAEQAWIGLHRSGARVVLTVRDDGRGFEKAAEREAGGGEAGSFGLRATRERVEQLEGTLEVDSAPGEGTLVTVTLEVEEA